LQDLHKQVLGGHGSKCIAACKALEAQRRAQDDSSAGAEMAPDTLRTMMDLQKARQRLDEAIKRFVLSADDDNNLRSRCE
jgi:hypothetical protein